MLTKTDIPDKIKLHIWEHSEPIGYAFPIWTNNIMGGAKRIGEGE